MVDFSKYQDIAYKIIGAAMEVHSELLGGMKEPIYQESLHLELNMEGIFNQIEVEVPCYYKNIRLEKTYRMDMLVNKEICVEFKSTKHIIPEHRYQVFNYMHLTKTPFAILLNFGGEKLKGERYGFDEETNECIILDKNMKPINELYIDRPN